MFQNNIQNLPVGCGGNVGGNVVGNDDVVDFRDVSKGVKNTRIQDFGKAAHAASTAAHSSSRVTHSSASTKS